MKEVTGEMKNGLLNVKLSGRVDSGNASDVEQEIIRIAEENSAESIVIDATDLEYVSSAGLRIF